MSAALLECATKTHREQPKRNDAVTGRAEHRHDRGLGHLDAAMQRAAVVGVEQPGIPIPEPAALADARAAVARYVRGLHHLG